MAVPKYIKEKMHRIVALNQAAAAEMQIVEQWLVKQGFDIEALRDGGGCSLEELEYGNDITDELCERIELENYKCTKHQLNNINYTQRKKGNNYGNSNK